MEHLVVGTGLRRVRRCRRRKGRVGLRPTPTHGVAMDLFGINRRWLGYASSLSEKGIDLKALGLCGSLQGVLGTANYSTSL